MMRGILPLLGVSNTDTDSYISQFVTHQLPIFLLFSGAALKNIVLSGQDELLVWTDHFPEPKGMVQTVSLTKRGF